MEIKFQQQSDDVTCTAACIAMIMNFPIERVLMDLNFAHAYRVDGFNAICDFFDKWDMPYELLDLKQQQIEFGNLYLAVVPSLNSVATNHHVIIDARDYIKVHDPNMGRAGKKYYTALTSDEKPSDAVFLKSYRLDLKMTAFSV